MLMGVGKMGFEEIRMDASGNRDDLYDAEISDFDVQKYYGIGHRDFNEIKQGAQNSCMLCFRRFGVLENKIVPPKRMQDRDYFVRRGILAARYVCTNCFNKSARGTPPRIVRRFRFKKRVASVQAAMYGT